MPAAARPEALLSSGLSLASAAAPAEAAGARAAAVDAAVSLAPRVLPYEASARARELPEVASGPPMMGAKFLVTVAAGPPLETLKTTSPSSVLRLMFMGAAMARAEPASALPCESCCAARGLLVGTP